MGFMEGFTGSLAIFGIFIFPLLFVVLIVWITSRNGRKKAEAEAQMMRDIYIRAIESGKDIPEGFLLLPKKKKANPLQTGIILLSVGIGLSLMTVLSAPEEVSKLQAAAVGILPAFIGLGFLVVYFIQRKQKTSGDEE